MEPGAHTPIEQMDFFKEYVAIADWAWSAVMKWTPFARDTVGKQLVRAIDRVGATLVEGDGRHSDSDAAHFFTIARGSARETRYWIERAVTRNLVSGDDAKTQLDALNAATRQLNAVIRYRRAAVSNGRVRESRAIYATATDDPLTERDC